MDTKEKILEAALRVIAEKGRHGATMEEIAKRAGVNKAMVYYYYTSKEKLHVELLKTLMERGSKKVYDHVMKVIERMNGDIDYVEIIKQFTIAQFNTYSEDYDASRVFMDAMSNSVNEISEAVILCKNTKDNYGEKLVSLIKEGKEKKRLRDIDPYQVFISIVGMNMIYFLGKPIKHMFELDFEDESDFLAKRKESIIDLILYGVVEKA